MKRLAAFVLTASLTLAGTTAKAVEHQVFIFNKYYFPVTVYFQSGDTIRFINKGTRYAALQTSGGSWITGAINVNKEQTLTISAISTNATITLKSPYTWNDGWSQQGSIGLSIERSLTPTECTDIRIDYDWNKTPALPRCQR